MNFLKDIFSAENLIHSDMLKEVLFLYVLLFIFICVSFLNIYSMDEIEYIYNEQKCIELKHKAFFIIQKSKNKKVISKKTFALELIGYGISLFALGLCIFSLFMSVKAALILIILYAAMAVFPFAVVCAGMYRKSQKKNFSA